MMAFPEKDISVSTHLDIELDAIPFHLVANGDSAIISFDSLTDALSVFRKMRSAKFLKRVNFKKISRALSVMGITVYLQNRHFGLIGAKAGTFLPNLVWSMTNFGRK